MKGFRFYLEFASAKDKRKGNDSGNVFAMSLGDNGRPLYIPGGSVEGIGAVYFTRNSDVCGTSADPEYLRKKCKRVSEVKARAVHPNLFRILDDKKS